MSTYHHPLCLHTMDLIQHHPLQTEIKYFISIIIIHFYKRKQSQICCCIELMAPSGSHRWEQISNTWMITIGKNYSSGRLYTNHAGNHTLKYPKVNIKSGNRNCRFLFQFSSCVCWVQIMEYSLFQKIFKKQWKTLKKCARILESLSKLHQNDYKQAYFYSQNFWDNLWYVQKQGVFFLL